MQVIDALWQDVRYAIRGLRRSPGLTATIVATFALGIGVNAALFTVVDRVYFQAPPGLVDPGAVHRLVRTSRTGDMQFTTDRFSRSDLAGFKAAVAGLAEIDGYDEETDKPVGDGNERRTVGYALPGFFRLAGVHADRGRLFSTADGGSDDFTPVAVLGYAYWKSRFSAGDDALGQKIRIDSMLYTVVGVMQRDFEGMNLDAVEIWVPHGTHPSGGEGAYTNVRIFARLEPGTDVRAVSERLETQYRRARPNQFTYSPGLRIHLAHVLQARNDLWLGPLHARSLALISRIAGVALLVLIIATSNVASLLLMRGLRRRREIAVRVALGVAPLRLMRMLVVESVILAIVGGAVAMLMALWTGGALRTLLLDDVRWTTTVVDTRVVVFTALLALVAGVIAGLAPGTIVLRREVTLALRAGSAEAGRPRSGLRTGLLVTQTALCMVMLASAGMFLQTLKHAGDVNRGFDVDRLISFDMAWIRASVVADAIERFRALPAVESITMSSTPLRGAGTTQLTFANGDTTPTFTSPSYVHADTAYARTIGLGLVSGRWFTGADRKETEPVMVINRQLARHYWSTRNPIGDCVRTIGAKVCARIVGVVENVRWDLAEPIQEILYEPVTQAPYAVSSITIRTRGPAVAETVRELHAIVQPLGGNPNFPPTPRRVIDRLEPLIRPWRIAAALFFMFGVLALAAAGAGIYGLVGFDVTQRTREFGIRITLGASTRSILTLVLGSGVRVVLIGLAVGLVAALASGRIVASLLFETSPYDPVALTVTAVVLTLATLFASLVPAWRATRVDPVVALRVE